MTNYKTVSAVLAVLAVIFAASAGYFVASPNAMSHTSTQTTTQTITLTQTRTVSGGVGSGTNSSAYAVGIAYNSTIGFYLTSSAGRTLYMFKADKPNNGTSACYGQCAAVWPAFYTANIANAPPGINPSSFGTITRSDGTKQLTLNGSPLYYFAADKNAGDTNGQGIGNVWYAYSLPSK